MGEASEKGGDIGALRENSERHDRVFCEFPFIDEEETDDDKAEDDEADDCGGGPWIADAPILEAEEKHDRSTGNGDNSSPINCLETSYKRRFGCFNVQKEEDDNKSEAIEGYLGCFSGGVVEQEREHLTIDIETPSPRDLLGKNTT